MNGIPVARVFGIEVRVPVGWLLILALIGYVSVNGLDVVQPGIDPAAGWLAGGAIAIAFFLSSTAHDLAHAIVARRRGLPVTTVAVSFFGGATPLDPTGPTADAELAIAVAGPITSIAIGVGLALVAGALATIGGPVLVTAATTVAVVMGLNFLLGFVNLLPAYPLDGGRVVRAIGWRRSGSMTGGWVATARTGRLTGVVLIGLGVITALSGPVTQGAMIAISGWFLVVSARSIAERLRVDRLIGGLHVEDAMETSPVSVGPNLTVDTLAGQLLDGESTMTAVPVVSEGDVVGILGVREVSRLRRGQWATTRVEDVMTKPPRLTMLSGRDSLASAVERLTQAGLDGLPVLDGRSLVGILTRRSVGQLLHDRGLLTREGRTVA